MRFLLQRSLLLLILFLLLTACVPTPGNESMNTATTPQATATLVSPSPTPTNIAIEPCPDDVSKLPGCFTPRSLRLAYGVQSLIDQGFTGKGQTIIDIVSFGSPTIKEDTEVFSKKFGLPPADIEVISPLNVPEHDPHNDRLGWAAETSLDVQIMHAIAPEAKIIVLVSPVAETQGITGLPEFRQLEQYAIDHKLGHIVSHSWGTSELLMRNEQEREEMRKWDELLQKGTTQHGITYFSSSGDHGATDYANVQSTQIADEPTTSFAANSPWITSVGGTTLLHDGARFTESVWNNGSTGSGGGFSEFYETPSYQKTLPASVQQQLKNRRGVPDVAAAADPSTNLPYYMNGMWSLAGGTSASAPIWAGIMALANQMAGRPLGFINPALYKLASSPTDYAENFRDITIGDNTNHATKVQGHRAVKGWDASTGLGSPIAEKLVPDLVATVPQTRQDIK